MPISVDGPSAAAASAIAGQLARLVGAPRPADRPLAGATLSELDLSATHPLFVATRSDVAAGALLERARCIGWRGLIRAADEVLASADATADDEPLVTQVNEGPYGPSVARALAAVEQSPRVARREYRLRTLQVPDLKVVALWLHADDDDLLVPLAPTFVELTAERLYERTDFEAALREVGDPGEQPADAVG